MQLILFFTDISSQIVILKWLHFLLGMDMKVYFTEVLLICFNSQCLIGLGLVGCLLLVVRIFVFFEPVFNIADASISIAIFLIIINYKTFFLKTKNFLRCDTIV